MNLILKVNKKYVEIYVFLNIKKYYQLLEKNN